MILSSPRAEQRSQGDIESGRWGHNHLRPPLTKTAVPWASVLSFRLSRCFVGDLPREVSVSSIACLVVDITFKAN